MIVPRSIRLCILALPFPLLHAQTGSPDPAGALARLTIARFVGSGGDSIQAMTSDADGNIYVAGTTSSLDLPMKNAMQPVIGEVPLMRSTDGGKAWQKTGGVPEPPLEIAPHSMDARILFLAGVKGIYRSSDSGKTWRQVHSWNLTVTNSSYEALNIATDPANPSQVYAAYVSGGVARVFLASADGGETWRERIAPDPRTFSLSGDRTLWVDPRGSGIVVLGLAVSKDRGLTWATMTLPAQGEHRRLITPDPHQTGRLYASTTTGGSGCFYVSTDWGATWTKKPIPDPPFIVHLLVDPDLPGTMYASTVGKLYVSRDAGTSWQAIAASEPGKPRFGLLVSLSRGCKDAALLSISGGAVESSPDSGMSWGPPQLTLVWKLVTGPECSVYAVRSWTSDAFVAKLSPRGDVFWSTFLGGSDRDVSVGIRFGPDGSVYVAGNTASLDFPTTVSLPRAPGRQNLFAVRLDTDGNLLYSGVLGGEAADSLTTLSVDSAGHAFLAGTTISKSFPTNPGAFQHEAQADAAVKIGFAVRLEPEGQLIYGTYLPYRLTNAVPTYSPLSLPPTPLALAPEADGSALIGGDGGILSRLSADGSTLTPVSQMPGQVYLVETDSQGAVYVAGQTTAHPLASTSCNYGTFSRGSAYLPAADIFVTKLKSGTLGQLYTARLSGHCRTSPTAMAVSASGEVTLGLWTFGQFPLRNPVQLFIPGQAAIARLSGDASKVLFSSYVGTYAKENGYLDVGARAVAPGLDDSLYAGVTGYSPPAPEHAAILQVPVLASREFSVNSITQTLTGFQQSVMPGSLLTIFGQNFSPSEIDLGLDYPDPLPTRLGGAQVLFDDVPAEMFRIAPSLLICLVPDEVKGKGWVTVQVLNERESSTPFVLRVEPPVPALLTRSFPAPPPPDADGEIRNADGTRNDAAHPAAPGSTVTLYAFGLSGPGRVELFWPSSRASGLVYGVADTMPGFIRALYQIRFRIPDALGPGVDYLPPPGVVTRVVVRLPPSRVGMYVK